MLRLALPLIAFFVLLDCTFAINEEAAAAQLCGSYCEAVASVRSDTCLVSGNAIYSVAVVSAPLVLLK